MTIRKDCSTHRNCSVIALIYDKLLHGQGSLSIRLTMLRMRSLRSTYLWSCHNILLFGVLTACGLLLFRTNDPWCCMDTYDTGWCLNWSFISCKSWCFYIHWTNFKLWNWCQWHVIPWICSRTCGLIMSQPGISEPVTDGDSNLASSQPRPQDDACVDGESTNHEPVGRSSPGKHPHPQEPSIVHVNAGKAKKRKQPSVKGRNVKSRSVDTSDLSTHIDPSLTQILGPSLNVMLATDMPLPDSDNSSLESVTSSPAATSSSSSGKTRATNKPTRYTAVKQQLKLQMEENERLIMSLRLLEQDIDDKDKLIEKLNKCESSQKLEIKKLSKANDNMRRELSNYKDSNVDTQQKCNSAISCVPSDLADLKGHVASVAKLLLAAVSENGDDTGFVPVTNRRQKPTVVRASNTVSSQAPTERISSPLLVRANKAVPPARGRSSAHGVARGQRPTSATSATPASSYRPSTAAPNKPSVAIIGTSLVRGLAHRVS